MNQYFLGSFGNKTFIFPQYELREDGMLRNVTTSRYNEFPNGGTVTIYGMEDVNIEAIVNRLIKFKIDFNKDLHRNYNLNSDQSNKYAVHISNVEELSQNEIIEVLELESPIDEFLRDKNKRVLKITHKPNKLLLLKAANDCYGPFEFAVTDVNSYEDQTYYTLELFINSGSVKKYNWQEVELICHPFRLRPGIPEILFIYSLNELEHLKPVEVLEVFDDKELIEYLDELLNESKSIDNINTISNDLLKIINTFSYKEPLSDKKIKRISELLKSAEQLHEYKLRIMSEYFRNNPSAEEDKRLYLEHHEELLENIVKADLAYESKEIELKDKLEVLEAQKREASSELLEINQTIKEQETKLKQFEEEVFKKQEAEYKEQFNRKKEELNQLDIKIKEAEESLKNKQKVEEYYKEQNQKLKGELYSMNTDIKGKIVEWAEHNRKSEIVKFLLSELELPELPREGSNDSNNDIEVKDYTSTEIANHLYEKISDAKRMISMDDVYNYLISIMQNYVIVLAGEPGTGKTSLCRLIAKALGIYQSRFSEVLVEKGWTSSKDLIGYYNPLTKVIEETQPSFSRCMKQLNYENQNNKVLAPYFVLLDEANLSPIEFYWSTFNHYADNAKQQVVEYANGQKYEFGDELKFLATINYDQTTAELSPRFLDRAWVIMMNSTTMNLDGYSLVNENTILNNEKIISLASLKNAFVNDDIGDFKINSVTKSRLENIILKLKEGGH